MYLILGLTGLGFILCAALVAQLSPRWFVAPFHIFHQRLGPAVRAEVPLVTPQSFFAIHHDFEPPYGLSRETCKLCYRVNRIGFNVPDHIWRSVVPEHAIDDVVCLECFTSLADEHLVKWDRDIEFFPVSLLTHLDGPKDEEPYIGDCLTLSREA
jgi:hypothetical protein